MSVVQADFSRIYVVECELLRSDDIVGFEFSRAMQLVVQFSKFRFLLYRQVIAVSYLKIVDLI